MFKFLNIFRRRKKAVPGNIVSLPLKGDHPIKIKPINYFEAFTSEEIDDLKHDTDSRFVDISWQTASVECPLCTTRWIAVWPVATINIECPNCANMIEPIIKDAP